MLNTKKLEDMFVYYFLLMTSAVILVGLVGNVYTIIISILMVPVVLKLFMEFVKNIVDLLVG